MGSASRLRAPSLGTAPYQALDIPIPLSLGLSWLRENGMAQTYGARFLQQFRLLGGSTKEWFPIVVASLAAADRKAFIKLVAAGNSPIDAELSAAANVVEPEALARRVFDRVERERATGAGAE